MHLAKHSVYLLCCSFLYIRVTEILQFCGGWKLYSNLALSILL